MERRFLYGIAALTALWAVLIVFAYTLGLHDVRNLLAPAYFIEAVAVGISAAYLWHVHIEAVPRSWILLLFSASAIIMLIGLIPGILLTTAHLLGWEPANMGVVIATSLLFIGFIPPITAFVIWRHR